VPAWRRHLALRQQYAAHAPDLFRRPQAIITSPTIACGGPDLKTLYITESLSGDILMAKLPVAGKKMFAHQ